MTGNVIKSFLVGLGFGVDDASLSNFNRAIASATLKVSALYASTKIAAAGVVYGISKISESFEQLGYEYRLITPAINKAIVLRRELFRAYSAAGINLQQTVLSSVRLNMSLTKTKYILDALYKSVGSKFFGVLTKQSDLFRQKIYANLPKIQAVLESMVRFIFKALDATTTLGVRLWSILTRVYDFFVLLDKKTDGWSTRILAVVAAWQFLNLKFLATPLGMLFALGLALLTLYDDFKTFKEGGRSLIDWGSETTKIMVGVVGVISAVGAAIYAVVLAMRAYAVAASIWKTVTTGITAAQWLLNIALGANPIGAIVILITALIGLLGVLYLKWDIVKKAFSEGLPTLSGIGTRILDFLGGAIPNLGNAQNPGGIPPINPLGAGNTSNSNQTNLNANLQTNVTIGQVPDAGKVGQIVTDQQSKNIFDLVRNMQGAIRPGGALTQ